jgi:DNA-binding MarR family transcriptional regulator
MTKKAYKAIYLEREMLESKAFLSLTGAAMHVLLQFYCRKQVKNVGKRNGRKSFDITNNGKIVFTYSEAKEKYGISTPRFRRAINNLIRKGFIDINHLGGGMSGDASKYYISDRWMKYGTEEFKEVEPPKDTRGLGFTKKNWEQRTGRTRKESKEAIINVG